MAFMFLRETIDTQNDRDFTVRALLALIFAIHGVHKDIVE